VEHTIIQGLFFVLLLALVGGLFARLLKTPVLMGYIIAGVIGGILLPSEVSGVSGLAEVGLILLLFSVGLELKLSDLTYTGKTAITGSIAQMILVCLAIFAFLSLFGFSLVESLVLAAGFSLSSTAIVVKMLEDRGETEAIHGEIMVGWLLTQDLAVIPLIALLPVLATGQSEILKVAATSISTGLIVVGAVFVIGRLLAPAFIRTIASTNSRELLVLSGVALALGTAYLVSFFGISPALGAFLAGVVISETQENHAVFSETRPLRNLFAVIFFVTLGFLISPEILIHRFPLIILITAFVLVSKIVIVSAIMLIFGYKGKTNLSAAIGLAQIGEFSFVIFITATSLGLLSQASASIGISTTLLSLILTPYMFRLIIPVWRILRKYKLFKPGISSKNKNRKFDLSNHIIICGYGRMGKWVGKALDSVNIPYIVIDYNQKVVQKVKKEGGNILFGDPSEPAILNEAQPQKAKAIVIAIPDPVSEEEVITYCQNYYPNLDIIARAHLDVNVAKLVQMKINKVIQPEFEAALSVVRQILKLAGKNSSDISQHISQLRSMHTKFIK